MSDKCYGCGKTITMKEAIMAKKVSDGAVYHMDCFVCKRCKTYLGGEKFFADPNDPKAILCEKCLPITTAGASEKPFEEGGNYQIKKPKFYNR